MNSHPHSSESEPFDAASAMKTYTQQRSRTRALLTKSTRLSFGVWGAAWTIGYTALWQGTGRAQTGVAWANAVFAGCILVAIVVSSWATVRAAQAMSGRTSSATRMFLPTISVAWSTGMVAIAQVTAHYPLPHDVVATLYNLVTLLLTGTLLATQGAIFEDHASFIVGLVIMGMNIPAVILGVPDAYLLMALLGGAMIVLAIVDGLSASGRIPMDRQR